MSEFIVNGEFRFEQIKNSIFLPFYRMHDFDQNSLLDGLEILQAISHIMPDESDVSGLGQPNVNSNQATSQDRQKQIDDDFNYYVGTAN